MRHLNDPRVTPEANGYTITDGPARIRVTNSPTLGWCIFAGPDLELVDCGYPSADKAVGAVLARLAVTS